MKMLIASLVLLSAFSANAGILSTTPGNQQIQGVSIATSASLTLNGNTETLSLLGSGLRSKKVIIANIPVYVAQLFATSSQANQFVRTDSGALGSLSGVHTVVLSLTFLRNVDAPTVMQSFNDALKANNISATDADMAAFLQAVTQGSDPIQGKTMIFALEKNADGTESITYEDTNGKDTTIQGTAGLTQRVMAIWLGTPADSGLVTLKASLLSGN